MSRVKLFCFPYAGGSSAIFSKWKLHLDPAIDLVAVELTGRGRRLHESLYTDFPAAVDDVFKQIEDQLCGHYALFGHSMGSRISYALAQKIRQHRLPTPVHAFFSGSNAPHVKRADERMFHLMDDGEFKREVMMLGGTPAEFFQYPELQELFFPVLRNDFKLTETEKIADTIYPLAHNITVFLGKDDDLSDREGHGWHAHTTSLCSVHYFNGGHFFLNDSILHVVRLINAALLAEVDVDFSQKTPTH